MLVGQQLGPFLIEKELGAGAMGAVYRGKYLKTGQVVAVKVMAPGLGTSSNSAAARFEREAKILKQLNHPNIVRLFGVGKYHGTPYYAMEYIKGESLDRIMTRRGRMSWEEVVDLGMQLCDALQHAHQAGIIHRDLKPSNLLILPDGKLKLADFGIAKDIDVTGLTGANCTIGTAAYMSPEQCKGDPNITSKSDLYSLGVVFYELITGNKPFVSESAMDMFLLHVKGQFERPSRIVLDLPVWLDTLICQLLEKKPEHRPLDAAMVASVLSTIQEKVEAQQSAGADAARARTDDRGKELTEEDREATRALLGKKSRKKKTKATNKLIWLQAGGLVAALLIVVGFIWWALLPPSAEKLYKEAERLMQSRNDEKIARAREKPIAEYLSRYGEVQDSRTQQIRKWADDFDAARFEKLFDRHIDRERRGKKSMAVGAENDAQKEAFKAVLAEYDGDSAKAMKLWETVAEGEGSTGLGMVARRHLQALARIEEEEKEFQRLYTKLRTWRKEQEIKDELYKQAFLAWRQEKWGDLAGAERRQLLLRDEARTRADDLQDSATRDVSSAEWQQRLADARFWQLSAASNSKKLKDALTKKPQEDKDRPKLIMTLVADAKKELADNANAVLTDLWLLAHDVAALYGEDTAFAEAVKEARTLKQTLDTRLGKP